VPTWILETNVFAEVCFNQMVEHFKKTNIPYHTVRVIPFVHEIDGKVPQIQGPCVVYGSIGVQKLARKHGWYPGVFNDPETFTYTNYRDQLGDLFLNPDAACMKLSEVWDYVVQGELDDFFIKPNSDNKEFAGTVLPFEDFGKWVKNMRDIGYLEENDFDVVVAEPKKLGCEWRVVVGDEISSCSIYRQYGKVMPELHIIPEVEELVAEAHSRFVPAPAYVIDIAQVGNEYKVIEYNTFNSAGLYACDVAKIINDINKLVDPFFKPL
jgi:hypothetical protein